MNKITLEIKRVHIPEIETEEVPILGREKRITKPIVEYKEQNWVVSAIILGSIMSGEMKLKDYYIKNGELYISEFKYRRR